MIDLTGRVLLVTGGTRGIGEATARAAVRAGADVVVHGRNADAARALAGELGDRAHAVTADLSDPAAAGALWDEALAWRGRIDVLVNNAGIYEPVAVDAAPDAWLDAWRRTTDVNLLAPAVLCRSAIRTFRESGGGTIVNVASRAAFRGDDPDHMHYAAAKAGLVGLTKTIARGFGRDGIVAMAVAPGFVRTDMTRGHFERSGDEATAAETALGEIPGPEDVAHTIVFLASGLARHLTGTTIDVNSGSYVR
ncbi:MAG TPA: SDR family NAD(P)-dependent oxidoreductase [Solirubrobacteraceae bacterium]|jgi:NAD(P)-dependent dehydrogenase (short-subunit alcohol dehydrogenase family)|nr:SDR family NAD(P)-dependent oxidoreductase [Solirubrobacteraceae bacterium]